MRTVGVDLAAEPAKTAVATIDWQRGRATLADVRLGATDDDLVAACEGAARVGIDSPFGWPDDFVTFISAHHRHDAPTHGPLNTRAARGPLVRRTTDDVVRERTGLIPLSVSADLIAHVALRCVGVLHALGVTDRVDGRAVEAYPAAALSTWGFTSRGYKGRANDAVRRTLVGQFTDAAPWFDLGPYDDLCMRSDDAFDAVLAAFLARAAAIGRTHLPTGPQRAVAVREGWIHLPDIALPDLATA
ncbi:DUF429 domain-containing protein [Williamsia sp.]|uniref:DUF429 domain-containing protein n=1 Tax=Williamsia sp. TaxID=1872085 RepID=UPI001A2D25BB|nr:DUF429 domain-containing protein [Williamsia sp.]MBJ7289420.1 DUF429 domain-containing protein [Williamsia sp.]